MRLTLIFSLLLLSPNLIAQDQGPIPLNFFNIRTAPLSLIDLYAGSCYKLGIEFKVKSKTSMTFEGGRYFKKFNGLSNITGQNIDIGIMHYIDHHIQNYGHYFSLNYFYKEQSFDYADTIIGTPNYYKTYRTQKFVTCLNLNFGWCQLTADRIFFDLYAGLG